MASSYTRFLDRVLFQRQEVTFLFELWQKTSVKPDKVGIAQFHLSHG